MRRLILFLINRAGARNYQRDGPMTVSGNQVAKIIIIGIVILFLLTTFWKLLVL